MTARDIRADRVRFPGQNGVEIDGYFARPADGGPFPVVVVVQEIFGVNEHIRDVTERVAREGYAAIAPALYQRQAPGFETGYTPEDVKIGREYKVKTQADELLGDIRGAIAFAREQPEARREGGVGCVGFCFGGHVAYLAATLPETAVTESFYGAGLTDWCPGDSAPTLSRTHRIGGRIDCFFGNEDASIPADQVERIEAELQRCNVEHRLFRYDGAEHGFFCDRRGSYNPEAAADAWEKVKEAFATL